MTIITLKSPYVYLQDGYVYIYIILHNKQYYIMYVENIHLNIYIYIYIQYNIYIYIYIYIYWMYM